MGLSSVPVVVPIMWCRLDGQASGPSDGEVHNLPEDVFGGMGRRV